MIFLWTFFDQKLIYFREIERAKAKREFNERMKQERLKDREQYFAREAAKKNREKELTKWVLLNRYKADENAKKYELDRKKQMWQEILKHRQELTEQIVCLYWQLMNEIINVFYRKIK